MLLIDTKSAWRFLDEWKADLWNTAGIPSPPGDEETNEAVVFGYLVAWFLGEVSKPTAYQITVETDIPSLSPAKRRPPSLRTSMSG